jgi:phosphinothricin acetyltransferase
VTPTTVSVRDATLADAPALAQIYNHYITESNVTFDVEPKTAEERSAWIAAHGPEHPVLVAEIEGSVVGFGALSPWAQRPAWHHTVELSSYVDQEWRRHGVGRALMDALLERAVATGHHALIGQIVADNQASITLSASMGFVEVGRLREVGDKFGRWHDVVLVERILDRVDS